MSELNTRKTRWSSTSSLAIAYFFAGGTTSTLPLLCQRRHFSSRSVFDVFVDLEVCQYVSNFMSVLGSWDKLRVLLAMPVSSRFMLSPAATFVEEYLLRLSQRLFSIEQ